LKNSIVAVSWSKVASPSTFSQSRARAGGRALCAPEPSLVRSPKTGSVLLSSVFDLLVDARDRAIVRDRDAGGLAEARSRRR
jgi:hypothetical protein